MLPVHSCKVIVLKMLYEVVLTVSICCSNLCTGNIFYNPSQQYGFPTEWPINVNINDIRAVGTETPLKFTAGLIEKSLVKNTGKSVIVQLDQAKTSDTISGGVLGPNPNDVYIYRFCRFYWVNNTIDGRAASTINGHGKPLETSLYYFNKKYDNFTNALNHRDGLAIFTLPIDVSEESLPNLFFPIFQYYLEKIKEPHTETFAILSFTYLWYVLFVTNFYYAYPGAYYDENTGKRYDCATIILHPEEETFYTQIPIQLLSFFVE